MGPRPDTSDGVSRREPFGAGWTGALTVGLLVYILFAIVMIFVGRTDGPVFEIFSLYCDAPACIAAVILAGSGRTPCDDARRPAHLVVPHGSDRRLQPRQPAELDLLVFGLDPFPSFGDVFFLGFYPLLFAAMLKVLRAADVRVQWGRLALDATILMLGFGTFFWFFVIARPRRRTRSGRREYVLTQELHRPQLPDADGVRRPAHERRRLPDAPTTLVLLTVGSRPMFLADIVWAMSKVAGHLFPGRHLGCPLPRLLRLARRRGARTSAQSPAVRRRAARSAAR